MNEETSKPSAEQEKQSEDSIRVGDIANSTSLAIGHGAKSSVTNIYIQQSSMEVSGEQTSVLVNRALANQIDRLASLITIETEGRLEEYRFAWREGRKAQVFKWLNDLKADTDRWDALSKSIKAKILRFEASLELDRTRDIAKAKQLADQAHELSPEDDDSRIRALIAYRETGPDAAIELLEGKYDIDSLNLKSAFLLEMGNPKECQLILHETLVEKGCDPDAETYRLRALAFTLINKINAAQIEIQKARTLAPNWESIRYTNAIVDYFSSLSPIAIQSGHIYWPIPIPVYLVKTDDESLARLRNAATVFRELSKSPDKSNAERLTFEVWHLACLLNNPDNEEEAINTCKLILRENPTDIRAIAWATSRRLSINLETSRKELKNLQKDGIADIPHILALVNIFHSTRKTKGALYLLERTRKKFKENAAESVWLFWFSQLLIFQGNPEAALQLIENSEYDDELKHAKTPALHAIVEKTGDWQPLIDYLEQSYQETGDPNYLLDICQIMAHLKKWAYVSERGEDLITSVQTGEALRIAAVASFNAGNTNKTLELLNKYQYLFSNNTLPSELAQLRVTCKLKLGIISEAILEAEKNALDSPTDENLISLINICYQKGDFKRLVSIARKLEREEDLPNDISLKLSRMVYQEDSTLAISLWRNSLKELPDSFVGEAIELGYRLGLDNEIRHLMIRMHKLGLRGEGGIQIATLDDLKRLITKQQENLVYLDEIYREGTAPIHIIAEQLNRSLSTFFHSQLEINEKSPDQLRQTYLLSRHGGRGLISGIPENVPKWRLSLDITAILLAEHLGILNNVENAFRPIRIPSLIVPALTQMREKVTHHQPSSLDNLQVVNKLVESGRIKIDMNLSPSLLDEEFSRELGNDWIAIYQEAKANDGYLVDFLPKKKIGAIDSPAILPEGAKDVLVNCRAVIDTLRQQGPLSQNTFEAVIEELGTESIKLNHGELPKLGSPLYCYANTIEILASTDILDTICDVFDVHIDRQEYLKLTSDLTAHEQMEKEVEWLGQLITKINFGIDRGIYEVIPMPFDIDRKKDAINNPSIGCLITLMKFDYQECDVIWVDDRFVNGYSRRDAVPIIGINEVLKSLVSVGELNNDNYFAILNRIRASNLRFVPVQSDEILFHIRQARLEHEQLIETQELSNLKRYIAASLFHGQILQRPPMPEGPSNESGEVEFLLSLGREIIGAIIELWISEKDEDACLARAEWLLNNLYLDHLAMSEAITWQRSNQDDLFLLAVSLSSFIAQAITFSIKEEGGIQDRRQKYLDWIYHRLLRTKCEANPTLLPTVAEIIRESLFSREDDTFGDVPKSVLIAFLRKYFGDLPEGIRNELELDAEFMQYLGYTSLIRIGELEFEPREFLNALSAAVNGDGASVHPLGSEVDVIVQPLDISGEIAVTLIIPGGGTDAIIQDDIFALLSNSLTVREETLLRHRTWFDCDNQTLEKIVSEIVSKEDPKERVELAEKWKNASAITYYNNLYDQLSKREPFNLDAFRPLDAKSLIRHHRLELDIEQGTILQDALDSSSKSLINEVGIFEAISRYWGLPIPLPKSILEAVKNLTPEEKRFFITRCLKSAGSPLSKLHLIFILVNLGSGEQVYYRLARRVIRNLLESDKHEFDAYFSVLNWTNTDFNLWPDTRDIHAHIRLLLVWAHAHRIFAIFKSIGAPVDWLEGVFKPYQPITSDLFERDQSLFYDVANPKQLSRPRLVVSGFQYCLGEVASNYLDETTKDLFLKEVFTEIGGKPGPHLTLIRDFSQATNALGSFLGGSFVSVLNSILGENVSSIFGHDALQLLVKLAIDKLMGESSDFVSWSHLHAVLDGLPPYGNLVEQLKLLFSKVEFARLSEEDPMLGILALQSASLQEPYLDDENLHSKLRDEVVNIASVLSNRDLGDGTKNQEQTTSDGVQQHFHGLLLDSALNLSITSDQPFREFAALITRLIDFNPSMIPLTRYMVQRLYDELPINQAKNLSSLLVRLRAEKVP